VDVFPDEAASPEEAAREAYESMIAADLTGEMPILEVTDLATGQTVDIDMQDQVSELEGMDSEGSED
jgi:hypothetical protein